MSYGNDKSDQIVAKMYYEAKAKRRYLARESFLSVSEVPVCLSLRYPLKKSRARGPRGHKRERERERWQQRGSLIGSKVKGGGGGVCVSLSV